VYKNAIMEKHINEIALIIDRTRTGEENSLYDSEASATKILQYIEYHFQIKEKFNFELEQQNW
jgi:hypothetical protein